MTIGIGFLTQEGVTLCSDRQLTNQVGGFKFEERKIFSSVHQSWSIVFGYAGDPESAQIMFRKISDNLDEEMKKSKLKGNVHRTRAALEKLFRDRNATNVQSLIGIRYSNGTCYLFKTSGHKVLDGAKQYIGVGDSSLLRYLCDMIPQHPSNMHEAEVIGCYLVFAANRYVDGCSGGPDVATVHHDGKIGENFGGPFPNMKERFLHCEEEVGKELRELLISGGHGYVRKLNCQLLKSQNRSRDHMTQSVQEQIGILPTIKAEGHLFEIGGKMLCADLVPRSHDAALQERERRLDSIGMNIAVDINPVTMANGLMLGAVNASSNHCLWVSRHFISDHHINIRTDMFLNILRQRSRLHITGMKEAEITAALPETNYNFFIVVGSIPSPTAALLAADIGFVHLDSTVQHRTICFLHGGPDAMAEIPSGFVADPKLALHLICRMSLAGFTKQQRRQKPFHQRQVRIVEDRSRCDRELIIAILAVEQLLLRCKLDSGSLTARALWAIGPAQPDKQLAAFVIGVEQIYNVN